MAIEAGARYARAFAAIAALPSPAELAAGPGQVPRSLSETERRRIVQAALHDYLDSLGAGDLAERALDEPVLLPSGVVAIARREGWCRPAAEWAESARARRARPDP